MKDFRDYSLSGHNTFGISCRAGRFVEYENEEELSCFLRSEDLSERKILHIGCGSNLLFMADFEGIVLHSAIRTIERVSEDEDWVTIRVGSGMVWDDFVSYTVGLGLYGAENLSIIPGEVGASAVQNIGAYGVEAKDIIVGVECIDLRSGERRRFSNAECRYAYRSSVFKHELKGRYAVTHVVYRLGKRRCLHLDYGNLRERLEENGRRQAATLQNGQVHDLPLQDGQERDIDIQEVREVIIKIRQEKLPDPKVTGNAGSFFMNPVMPREKFESLLKAYPEMPHYPAAGGLVKIPAGWLIDRCGWKGRSLGKAGVHERQALVLVNRGGATGEDVMRLANAVRGSVKERFGIEINPEVNIIP